MTDLETGADIRERFDRALTDLSAPSGITEAALARGHRLRRRRRVLTASTGVAAAAVVTGLLLANLGGGTASTQPDVATQPSASPSADLQTPSLAPDYPDDPFPEPPAGWWDMPGTEMLRALKPLLPDGVSVVGAETRTETGDPEDPWTPGSGSLHGVLEGPDGPGAFQILLIGAPAAEPADPVATTIDADGNEITMNYAPGPTNESRIKCRQYQDSCEAITDASGDQIGHVASNVERGTSYFEVALLGPDGGALYFYVADSTGEKPGYKPPTATAPPLTPEQLRTLAEDPVWTSYTP